jgi:hypothetical protein
MFHTRDDPIDEPSAVSAALTEQMLHLGNRFHEERRKLEERTFRPDAEDASKDQDAS